MQRPGDFPGGLPTETGSGRRHLSAIKAASAIRFVNSHEFKSPASGKETRRGRYMLGGEKREIQDAKLRRKKRRSPEAAPLSGRGESGARRREAVRWSGFLGHSL